MVSIHDRQAVEAVRQQHRIEPGHLRELLNGFYKKARSAEDTLAALPPAVAATFARETDFSFLTLRARHDSTRDGASKLLFRTADDLAIESVILRIRSGRTSLCVSSQAGCAAGCRFCATGQGGLTRNLTASEICDQVVQANRLLAEEQNHIRNVVFMGMGEPFHNETAVCEAIDLLRSPRRFDLSERKLLISTLGIPDAMVRFAARFRRAGLAVSLHSAVPETRWRLMPLTRRWPLADLRAALVEAARLQGQDVFVEYLLLDGVNDTEEELARLEEWLAELPARLMLIPFNAFAGAAEAGLRPTAEPRRAEIAERLYQAGFHVTLRYSLGHDIAAACGQLAGGHPSATG
jgi:23S rRNA (adenine2503-C2)-methyltransferase